ncbi:hypothetical protein [Rhizobium laguerreae]|uniref:hypothetical protein n=1 Tax=Rhizobium laguerreae TaxID=1076926 RepID=UPI001C921FCB|nr:hypothetical protein [Rhizobium laguerreae]MBY3131534.1 hypothetical protein [Rhizobium laguerreae]
MQEIERFLASPDPEVLCVRGKWGTGKTYNWKTIAKAAKLKDGGVAMNTYAYISLFGVNSLGDIKMQIVQATVPRSSIGDPNPANRWIALWDKMETTVKKTVTWGVSALGKNQFEAAMAAMSVTIERQIICIDDLERKGAGLSTADVLGLVSYYREEKQCKIAILLNDEVLEGDEKKAFVSYLEKVVDVNLLFAPTAKESAAIAIRGTDETSERVRENCIALKIENVRVISKILRLVRLIEPMLKDYEPGVLNGVVDSLVLFGWSHHEPNIAPSTEFLYKYGRIGWDDKLEKTFTEQETAWRKLLDSYPFHRIDEFDQELIKGVSRGYFAPDAVTSHAAELHSRIKASKAMAEWQDAWDQWRYSFRSTADEVISYIAATFERNIQFMTNDHLNSIYDLCKRMKRDDKARELLDLFIRANAENREAFNAFHAHYHGEKFHPDLKSELEKSYDSTKAKRGLEDLLIKFSEGWDSDVIAELDHYSSEDMAKVFLAYEGDELKQRIMGISDLRRIGSADPARPSLIQKFNDAMRYIGKTNDMNAERVERTWGVKTVDSLEEPKP